MSKNIVKMIVVDADGEIITSANGLVSSDNPELVRAVKRSARFGTATRINEPFGEEVEASLDPENLVGQIAALFSARPGRTRLLEAPIEVHEWLRSDLDESHEDDYSQSVEVAEMDDEKQFIDTADETMRLLLGLEGDNDTKEMKK